MIRNMIFRGFLAGALGSSVIVAASAVLYSFQDRLIYLPNHPSPEMKNPDNNPFGYINPMDRNIPYDNIFLTTDDGCSLHSWFLKQSNTNAPTILFFHANAGNMGMRMDYLEQLYKLVKANVFIISYRGYGKSEGVPSEQGIMLDAKAAIEHINKLKIDKNKIFLYGRSLGGAVAIYTA